MNKLFRLGLWAPLLVILVACQSVVELRDKPYAAKSRTKPDQLEEFLAAGDKALARDQLSVPLRNSAFELYRNALVLDPENSHARRGLGLIGQRYAALANAAMSRGNSAQALEFLSQGLRVEPRASVLINLRKSLLQLQQKVATGKQWQVWPLDKHRLAKRDQRLAKSLQVIAGELVLTGDRIAIYSRTEAEARWVYQQLRQAWPGHRFVVTTGLSSKPRIVRAPVVGEV